MSSGNTRKLSAEITEIKEAERRKENRTIRNKINKKKYLFFSYMKGNIRKIIWKRIIYGLEEINKN